MSNKFFVKILSVLFFAGITIASQAQNIPIVISYFPPLNKGGNLCFDRNLDYKEKWENIAKRYNINNKKLMGFNDEMGMFIKKKQIRVPLVLNSNLFMKPSAQRGTEVYVPVYYLIKVSQKVTRLSTIFKEPLLTFIKNYNKIKDHYTLNRNAPIFIGYLKVTKEFGWNFAKNNSIKNYNTIDDFQNGKNILAKANATKEAVPTDSLQPKATPKTTLSANKLAQVGISVPANTIKENIGVTQKIDLVSKNASNTVANTKGGNLVGNDMKIEKAKDITTNQSSTEYKTTKTPTRSFSNIESPSTTIVNNRPSLVPTAQNTTAATASLATPAPIESIKNISNTDKTTSALKDADAKTEYANTTANTNNATSAMALNPTNKTVNLKVTDAEITDIKEEPTTEETTEVNNLTSLADKEEEKFKKQEEERNKEGGGAENEDVESTSIEKTTVETDAETAKTTIIAPAQKNEAKLPEGVNSATDAAVSEVHATVATANTTKEKNMPAAKTKSSEEKPISSNSFDKKLTEFENKTTANAKESLTNKPIITGSSTFGKISSIHSPNNSTNSVTPKEKPNTSFFKPEFDEDKEAGRNEENLRCTIKIFKLMFDESDNKYYVLFNKVPPGSVVKITHNDKTIFAKVISSTPSSIKQPGKDMIVISELGSKVLGVLDNTELSVGLLK